MHKVLCVLELLLCVHLLLADSFTGLNVFVLNLVVWILIILALCGLSTSLLGLWIVTHMIGAAELLGIESDPSSNQRNKRRGDEETSRGRQRREETTTLLTDGPSTATADTTTAHDESILSASIVQVDDDEECGVATNDEPALDPSSGIRAVLRDSESAPSSSVVDVGDAGAINSFSSVTVHPVQVHESRSLNSTGANVPVVSSMGTHTAHATTMSFGSNPTYDNVLSAYLNMSVLQLILYFGFSLLLLAQRGQVADYVHSHALMHGISPIRHSHGIHSNFGRASSGGLGDMDDPTAAADVLRTQLGAYLAVMGVCALFSSKLMSLTTFASWIIQRHKPPTQQAYLTAHLTTGV